MNFQVLLFYKYVHIDSPESLRDTYITLCEKLHLTGRTIVSEEGINGTLEGTMKDTQAFMEAFLQDARFADMQVKRSVGDGKSFKRLSVKIRQEIVGTRFPKEVDPTKKTAQHLKPEELRKWYEDKKDFVVVDMRNSYEFESGHFKNSIDPGMDSSRELPRVIEKIKQETEGKTILTVCTGGVRCEKMSAYLLHEGFDEKNVYQLDGGMHSYMEKYPGKDFLGTLFTFDERLVMDFGGEREVIGKCKRCDAKNEQYQNCANAECNMLFLICNDCMSSEGPGFCSSRCEKSTARVVNRVRS